MSPECASGEVVGLGQPFAELIVDRAGLSDVDDVEVLGPVVDDLSREAPGLKLARKRETNRYSSREIAGSQVM